MRLIAWRNGSLGLVNRKRAMEGLYFEYLGHPDDLIFDYSNGKQPFKVFKQQHDNRISISKQSKGVTYE